MPHPIPILRRLLPAILCPWLSIAPALMYAHAASSTSRLAEVRYIYHGLSFWPPQQQGRPAAVHTSLFSKYGLRTKSDERGSIRFGDGTTLHINVSTDIVLGAHLVRVQRGEV